MNKKVLVAMSGGVDSSTAAYLLKSNGYECTGATMRLFLNGDIGIDASRPCCSKNDVDDAAEVAKILNINHEILYYMVEFKKYVIDKFIKVYKTGGTPNPCVDCNKFLKFNAVLNYALSHDIDYIATGHYARIIKDENSGRYILKRALDLKRDQSYVLYMLTQQQLEHVLFPLGELTKDEVRKTAELQGFVNARKRDSQDICFVPDKDYAKFIENYTGEACKSGDFVEKDTGKVLGQHKGIIRYTIGQRKGLGIAAKSPLYVSEIDIAKNRVILSYDEKDLFAEKIIADNINLIPVPDLKNPIHAAVKIRYRQEESPAAITQIEPDKLLIEFDEPQRAPAVGQAAVIYDGDMVIGGGTIAEIIKN